MDKEFKKHVYVGLGVAVCIIASFWLASVLAGVMADGDPHIKTAPYPPTYHLED
jgi:hypothetical protein